MDIEKYYWEAKDENEARVIFGLLSSTKMRASGRTVSNEDYGPFHFIHKGRIDSGDSFCHCLSNRTLSTIRDLLEMALRGFKEPWEVAPEGYRLVTDDERKKYKTTAYTTMICSASGNCWGDCSDNYTMTDHAGRFFYAVPLDFTFEPEVKEMSVEEISEVLGYTVKVVK